MHAAAGSTSASVLCWTEIFSTIFIFLVPQIGKILITKYPHHKYASVRENCNSEWRVLCCTREYRSFPVFPPISTLKIIILQKSVREHTVQRRGT